MISTSSFHAKALHLKLLLLSPFSTPEAQKHILDVTECKKYLHSTTLRPLVDQVLGEKSNIPTLEVPELSGWLNNKEASQFPYTKTWDQAKSDPWLISHTSGTTGEIGF